jgi:hypothetical protein
MRLQQAVELVFGRLGDRDQTHGEFILCQIVGHAESPSRAQITEVRLPDAPSWVKVFGR